MMNSTIVLGLHKSKDLTHCLSKDSVIASPKMHNVEIITTSELLTLQ